MSGFLDGKIWGPDVSQYWPVKDWDALAASGATFFAAKATEGSHFVDAAFISHRDGFRARPEFSIGVWYHFFHAEKDPASQAELFAQTVGELRPRERLCLDFEGHSYATLEPDVLRRHGLGFIEAFFDELDQYDILKGTRPLVYTGLRHWQALGNPTWVRAREIDLWVARYHDPPMPPDGLPQPWRSWYALQWTDNKTGVSSPVDGIGDCDVNVLNDSGD
jgi:lysozyme